MPVFLLKFACNKDISNCFVVLILLCENENIRNVMVVLNIIIVRTKARQEIFG